MSLFLLVIIFLAGVSFYFGVTQPLMVFEKLFFFESEASLLEIVEALWKDQSWPLAIVVGLFSIIFPAAKLLYLTFAALLPKLKKNRWLSFLGALSKWSMLDVLVVAIIIVATKTSGLAKATAQPGLWFFTASVVLMAIATIWIGRKRR